MKQLLANSKSETLILDYYPSDIQPNLPDYQFKINEPGSFEVVINKEQGLNQLFSALSQQGINVISMHNKANRLEELFIDLVSQPQGGAHV